MAKNKYRNINQNRRTFAKPCARFAFGDFFVALFGLPFLAGGLFAVWQYTATYCQWWQAQRWVQTPCWIEAADLTTHSGSESDASYTCTARYRYQYGGRTWTSYRVALGRGVDNVGAFDQRAHAELAGYVLPAGANTAEAAPGVRPFRCYVNPDRPAEAVLYRELRLGLLAIMMLLSLTFPVAGVCIVAAGVDSWRTQRRLARLREANPEAPWRWKETWAGDCIQESRSPAWTTALYGCTLWTGMLVLPMVFAALYSGAFLQPGHGWQALLFLAFWGLLARSSLRCWYRRQRTGDCCLALRQMPVQPGGRMMGELRLGRALPAAAAPELKLCCVECITTGTDSDSSTSRVNVWQHHVQVPPHAVSRTLDGARIPVAFAIPVDAPAWSKNLESEGGGGYEWSLHLNVPGTPVRAEFAIPVFCHGKVPLPDADAPPPATSLRAAAAAALPAELAACGIRATFDAAGCPRELVCPPARNKGIWVFLTLFNVLWSGLAVFIVNIHAPIFFQVVWPGSAVLIWVSVAWLVLYGRTARFTDKGVAIYHRLGPLAWERYYDRRDILAFHFNSNISSGDTRYYRVGLTNRRGKGITLVNGLPGERMARALHDRLRAWRG